MRMGKSLAPTTSSRGQDGGEPARGGQYHMAVRLDGFGSVQHPREGGCNRRGGSRSRDASCAAGDRFQMRARNTTLERPVYALTLARADGSLGRRLHRTSDIDCRRFFAARGGALPPLRPDPKDVPTCVIRAEPGLVVARARTMLDLVTVAFPRVVEDRVVVDRTVSRVVMTCFSSGRPNQNRSRARRTSLRGFRFLPLRPPLGQRSSQQFRNSSGSSCSHREPPSRSF
jgi:hypothetical protein